MSRLSDVDGTFQVVTGTKWGGRTEMHWAGEKVVIDDDGRLVWIDSDGSAFVLIGGERVPVSVEVSYTVRRVGGAT